MKKEDLYTLVHFLSDKEPVSHEVDIDFLKLVEIANHEFLTSAFFYQLDKNDFFKVNSDEELFLYLSEIFRLNTVRNTQIIDQLKEIISIFNSANIKCLLLKGAASLVENDYDHIGIRFLSDIDLMVHPEQIEEAYALLINTDYSKINTNITFDLHHHLCPIKKDCMPVVVELHHLIVGRHSGIEYIPFSTATTYKCKNQKFSNTWVLNPTYKLYHTFLHTEISDNNYYLKHLDLRHIYDFTVLTKKYYDKIEWNKLDQLIKSFKLINNFQSYLYVCKKLFDLKTPLTVENKKVRSDYHKIIKSYELQGSLYGNFYSIFLKLEMIYAKERLKRIYHYTRDIYYIYYILKYTIHLFKTRIFCKSCFKKFISKR